MKITEFLTELDKGKYNNTLSVLYGCDEVNAQKARYAGAVRKFTEIYPQNDEIGIFSAPGRSEIGGNHTDHQHGCVLAAAVDVDVIAVIGFNDSDLIKVVSEGYTPFSIKLDSLDPDPQDNGTAAMIRGIVSKFTEAGIKVGGFDMYATSDVLSGSGISSSAAFETLIGTVIDKHYNDGKAGAVEIAKIGQYAENNYFGKKSGLMDQMVSSVGGFVFIDFKNTENPFIESCNVDFGAFGYDLFITDTKGSHADLSDEYSAVPAEMRSVAEFFGKEYLRQVDCNEFWARLPEIRKVCCDRAIMRAMHFLDENLRPRAEFDALKAGDIAEFLRLVNESGESSERLLQNIYSVKKPLEQAVSLGLAISRKVLCGEGACRVHGGGFAGTIQAFVPKKKSSEYKAALDRIFGTGSCRLMRIRPVGGIDFIEYAEGKVG